MDNPYQSPDSPPPFSGTGPPPLDAALPSPGMVGQVRVAGILLAVQGGLAILMGGALIVYGMFMPMIFLEAAKQDPNLAGGNGPNANTIGFWMVVVMCGFGAVILAIGALQIVGGIRCYQFRSRGLVIGALVAGLLPVLSCYCAPTAIAMAVYGLIVLFNTSVVGAFEMGKQKMTGDEILAAIYQGRSLR